VDREEMEMKRKYTITSMAGDGINDTSHDMLDAAQAAVVAEYGEGAWEEVSGTDFGRGPEAVENSYEYFSAEDDDDEAADSVARIDSVPVSA
jgi:hypothetical protein